MKLIVLIILSFFLYIVPYAGASEFGLFGEPLPVSVTPVPTTAISTGGGGDNSSGGGGSTSSTGDSGADLDGNGKVDIFDLSTLLRNWNKNGQGDLNGNSLVDVFDLSIMLRSWSK